jgi:hypothetical protein
MNQPLRDVQTIRLTRGGDRVKENGCGAFIKFRKDAEQGEKV